MLRAHYLTTDEYKYAWKTISGFRYRRPEVVFYQKTSEVSTKKKK